MRWLTRRRSKVREEHGAVAVAVALSIVPLLAILALVVDVGLLYWERGELQNGADAAALAVAQECAVHPDTCTAEADAIADEYAGGNANDDVSGAAIPASTFILDGHSGTVTVKTSTLTDEGTTLKHPLASIVGLNPTTVLAEGTAEWGTPVSGTTLPLAVAACEFDDLPAQPPETTTPVRTLLLVNTGGTAEPCASGYPGGFGWLDGVDCQATMSEGSIMPGTTGVQPNEIRTGCTEDDFNALLCETVLIPLYSATSGTGSAATFTISRFAAFKVTGTRTGGTSTTQYCGGATLDPAFGPGAKGLQGYFVRYVELGEDFELGDGGDGGLMVVRLTTDP